jgi:uncharacterized membrane protein YeaQ/YmgE (transglycosylase-associated protein family)
MPLIIWIVLGLIVGFSASKLLNKPGESHVINLVMGTAGAMAGGELFIKFWMAGARGLSLGNVLSSAAGAVVFLLVYHALQDEPLKRVA